MRPLRVLHVTTSLEGGAGRATHRIHRALRASGVDSQIIVSEPSEPVPDVLQPYRGIRNVMRQARQFASGKLMLRQHTPTNPAARSLNWFSSGLANWINQSDFDLVNLHWVGGETLSIEEIGRLQKPICWTMHDMWPFCGAEHYDDLSHPGRYREGYSTENRPADYGGPDLDAWVWRRKRAAWRGKRFLLVCPSHWLADCARESALMAHHRCEVVPNCIDRKVFKVLERRFARHALGLDPEKKYVLFGAVRSTSDLRKGFHLLKAALRTLASREAGAVELLVFGGDAGDQADHLGLPAHFMGNVRDDLALALLYNAADVFVAPSMQDNLPNTVVESLACGTPCVAFRIGGMPDLIEHGRTGWLAKPYDTLDLLRGLDHCLNSPVHSRDPESLLPHLFNEGATATKYEAVYAHLLEERTARPGA